jgi:D-threo-aldose 1-dehydrogenase
MIKKKLGKTDIKLTPLGFGGAPMGDLFERLKEEDCYNTLKKSYENGINIYDTSPFYGYGLSEHRLGNFLKSINREDFYISTKVGRYLSPDKEENIDRGIFKGGLQFKPTLDYTYDGVMRSFEQSFLRLGLSSIDICLIHDVDRFTHGDDVDKFFKIAMDGAYKALRKLKDQELIKAIGIGVNEAEMCTKFAESGDFDCMVMAGRYTLLEQGAIDSFFPIAEKQNIGIILAGVFNSGILVKGVDENSTYDYGKIPENIKKKYFEIDKICQEFNIPIAAAALQFCNANDLISTMIIGMDRPIHVQQNLDFLDFKIEKEFWEKLKKNNLIDERSPTPNS